jgi:ribosomal protein L19
MSSIIDAIEKEQLKTDVTNFKVGDGVRVHTRVVEGDKERIQIFAGIVIGRKGRGLNGRSPCAAFHAAKGRAGVSASFAAHH